LEEFHEELGERVIVNVSGRGDKDLDAAIEETDKRDIAGAPDMSMFTGDLNGGPDRGIGEDGQPEAIAAAFADGPAYIPYLAVGDPDYESSKAYVEALDRGGADIIELGLPFSEPIAEGRPFRGAGPRARRRDDAGPVLRVRGGGGR